MGTAILDETLLGPEFDYERGTLGMLGLSTKAPDLVVDRQPSGVEFFAEGVLALDDELAEAAEEEECRPHPSEDAGGRVPGKRRAVSAEVNRQIPQEMAQEIIPDSPGAAVLREFDAIHQKYEQRVYRQCFRMVRNQEDAEDLTQEVFLQLFRKAHTFRGESNFSTWLHRLTVNTVLMRLRRQRRWRDTVTSLDVTPGSEQDAGDVLTLVSTLPAPPASTVEKISLDVAIAQLSSGYREVFLLHDSEGYRHDEIASKLGISEGTSKSQLHKARFKLRELIESSCTEPGTLHRMAAGGTAHQHKTRQATPAAKFVLAERHPNLVGPKKATGDKRRERHSSSSDFHGE